MVSIAAERDRLRIRLIRGEGGPPCAGKIWTGPVGSGGLTLESGTGQVSLAENTGRGQVPLEDVAALLDEPRTAGLSLDLISGDIPIDEAVAALVGSSAE